MDRSIDLAVQHRQKLNQEKSRNVPKPFSKELEDWMVGELKGVELSKRDKIVSVSKCRFEKKIVPNLTTLMSRPLAKILLYLGDTET